MGSGRLREGAGSSPAPPASCTIVTGVPNTPVMPTGHCWLIMVWRAV